MNATTLSEWVARRSALRWAVLAVGIAFSLGAAFLLRLEIREQAGHRFRATALDKAAGLDARVRAYSEVLYALRGLFNASPRVTRDDFHEFAAALSLGERYPGLTNLSFSPLVRREERAAFERAVRADPSALVAGLPRFAIKPAGEPAESVVLNYVEPMGKNVAAWGLDLLAADPVRRSVVERARDTGDITSVSGVTLVRDSSVAMTSTLLRLAVYRGGGMPATREERRARFAGVVGSTLRVGEMVEATLKADTLARMRVRIFDRGAAAAREAQAPEQLLYDSHPADAVGAYGSFEVSQRITAGDREWRVAIEPLVDPTDAVDGLLPVFFLMGMIAATLLLFWLVSSLTAVDQQRRELAQRNREAALLTTLGDDLHSCRTSSEAGEVLAKRLPELLPQWQAVLYQFDASRSRASALVRVGAAAAAQEDFAPADCQAVRRGHAYQVDGSSATHCSHFLQAPPQAYACLPLNAQGELIGVLHVQAPAFTEGELNIVKAVAQHLALALANLGLRDKLLERATRDSLTGLYNRHYMRDWFEQELHRAARHARPIGVVMLDIDHFKRVNDVFGHEAGDLVLKELAALLVRSARKSDAACRLGGEEFVLLLPEASVESALAKAEQVRAEVSRLVLFHEGRSLGTITVSAGVAAYPLHATTASVLLRQADAALYAAKHAGRNRCMLAEAPPREAVVAAA